MILHYSSPRKLIHGPRYGKIILDYPDGPNIITWILKSGKPFQAVVRRNVTMEAGLETGYVAGIGDGRRGL